MESFRRFTTEKEKFCGVSPAYQWSKFPLCFSQIFSGSQLKVVRHIVEALA